ncbi:hypothetical protein ACJX0J_013765 [Zea mays]
MEPFIRLQSWIHVSNFDIPFYESHHLPSSYAALVFAYNIQPSSATIVLFTMILHIIVIFCSNNLALCIWVSLHANIALGTAILFVTCHGGMKKALIAFILMHQSWRLATSAGIVRLRSIEWIKANNTMRMNWVANFLVLNMDVRDADEAIYIEGATCMFISLVVNA